MQSGGGFSLMFPSGQSHRSLGNHIKAENKAHTTWCKMFQAVALKSAKVEE